VFADFADPVPRLLDHADNAYFAPIEEVVALPGRPVASRSSATPQKTLVESNAGAAPASPGCRSKPIAVTARGACRRQIRT
jgi:hypothetical protein